MTPSQLASLRTRVRCYKAEDGRERAVLLWDDWMAIVQELTPIETKPPHCCKHDDDDDNGGNKAAFPFVVDDDKGKHTTVNWGISHLDYFAAHAQLVDIEPYIKFGCKTPEARYRFAIAMLAQRQKP